MGLATKKSPNILRISGRLALRPAEAAEAMGISERHMRQLLPEVPHCRLGGAIVIPIEPLREWLKERTRAGKCLDTGVEEVLDELNRE